MHALLYTNELVVRVRLSFQILLHAQHVETVRKNIWEKSNDSFSLSLRVQTTLNQIRFVFYHNINDKESILFFQSARSSASWKWHYVTYWSVPCLYSYRQWQISQSDCEISGNCGKKILFFVHAWKRVPRIAYFPLKSGFRSCNLSVMSDPKEAGSGDEVSRPHILRFRVNLSLKREQNHIN